MPQLKRPTSRYTPPPVDPTEYETINIRRINYTLELGIQLTFAIEENNPEHKFGLDADGNTWIDIDGRKTGIPKSRVIFSESYPDTLRRPYKPKT